MYAGINDLLKSLTTNFCRTYHVQKSGPKCFQTINLLQLTEMVLRHSQTICRPEIPKRVLLQTVKTQMKCH